MTFCFEINCFLEIKPNSTICQLFSGLKPVHRPGAAITSTLARFFSLHHRRMIKSDSPQILLLFEHSAFEPFQVGTLTVQVHQGFGAQRHPCQRAGDFGSNIFKLIMNGRLMFKALDQIDKLIQVHLLPIFKKIKILRTVIAQRRVIETGDGFKEIKNHALNVCDFIGLICWRLTANN